jgi:glycyl-tRNA synthetase beta chain
MPEFFLELFSEEIPARMQLNAAIELTDICNKHLKPINFSLNKCLYGPRRIAISGAVNPSTGEGGVEDIRGPRETAPEAALNGFLRKHAAEKSDLTVEAGFFVLKRQIATRSATEMIAADLPPALAKFSWPKSMRWGQSGDFTWVRPLRRIVCLLDGEVIPITLGPVTASHETEGHRFLAPGAFAVSSAADWEDKLTDCYVIADQTKRRQIVVDGISAKAQALGLNVVEDLGLIDEVTGLVEWPVPLIGKIDEDFMDLPPEVRELSMKVNQRYFALRDAAGNPAPYFAFVSNIPGQIGAAAIISGNERVLRARLSDARHFWDLDLKIPLDQLLPKLDKIIFHAKIGSQRERVKRIANLARDIASTLGADEQTAAKAEQAGLLSKADLVTGMVGEFPELQGIIGGYYAEKNPNGWDGKIVGPAIKTHYQPKGPSDAVPAGIVAISVALADKLDTLIQFFRINEKPTGSGDPYALRRAALGVIRIIVENDLHLSLKPLLSGLDDLFDFIIDRLRVKLRGEGNRFDVLNAVLGSGTDDDLVRIMQRVNAVTEFLQSEDGSNLLVAYRRTANILKIEDADGDPLHGDFVYNSITLSAPEELPLLDALRKLRRGTIEDFRHGHFDRAMAEFAQLRDPVDDFFTNVTVNDPDPEIRRNRLRLLAQLRDTMHQIADFSKIEG